MENKNINICEDKLFEDVRTILISARNSILRQINNTMVAKYYEIGRLIVKNEQKGEKKAEYGTETLIKLSEKLSKEFGKGYSVQNIQRMRQLYIIYSKYSTLSSKSSKPILDNEIQIRPTLSVESLNPLNNTIQEQLQLSWSHYVFLLGLDEPVRKFYEIESNRNNWSLRELRRQFNSGLYERLVISRNKEKILELSSKGQIIEKAEDIIKDPYIFEFLGLKEDKSYSENDIETRLIDNLEHFILELGKGFAFVERQQRISIGEEHFYIDLVFYNRFLKCFVLFDLKVEKLKHQDIGQLQMYVNYFDRKVILPEENKTIGILLCADKNDAVVKMTLPNDSKNIFASKYKLYLPSENDLIKYLEKNL